MIEIENITADPFQRHVITTPDGAVTLLLRFYPRAQFWTISAEYAGIKTNGLKLSLGTLHMRSKNMPFDFLVVDQENAGIDPFTADDFESRRCVLLMLERDDMEEIRGQPIAI
jgi:hypothetical protein